MSDRQVTECPSYGFAYFAWHRLKYYRTPPGDPTRYWRWDQFRMLQLTGKEPT